MRFQASLNNKAIYHGLNDYLNIYDINTTDVIPSVGVYVWKFKHPHPLSNITQQIGNDLSKKKYRFSY